MPSRRCSLIGESLLTSLLGVVFSVVLVNLQGGLLLGMIQKASLLVDYGQADIWVGHRHTTNVDMGTFIPERWIHRIRGIEGVERAEPYIVMFGQMTMPDGQFENVVIVGQRSRPVSWATPGSWPTAIPARSATPTASWSTCYDSIAAGRLPDRRRPRDQRAPGPDRGDDQGNRQLHDQPLRLHDARPGPQTVREQRRGRRRTSAPISSSQRKPGADLPTLCDRIRARVPELDVYDRDTYSWICMEFWLTRTGIGISFGMAAFLGLLVGLAVVAQTLYATVTERIKEFGTLKAMGADDATSRISLSPRPSATPGSAP